MKVNRKFLRKSTAVSVAFFVLLANFSSFASVLGKPGFFKYRPFSQGAVVYTNTFVSDDVGKQTEHYVEYTPNPETTPILTNGDSVYGKRTITQANSFLTQNGLNTAIGINADFFSLQTGVPMSNVIIDKKVISKDAGWLPAVGFKEDGTAFMGQLPITTTLTVGNGCFTIECINKYRQPYSLYLYTRDFGSSTYAEGLGINVVLSKVSSDITLNSTITAVVESIYEYDGAVAIPDGKMILSVSSDASDELKARIASLSVGDKVTIDTQDPNNDKRWLEAKYALGAQGGKLITNGQLDYKEDSSAPRTAIGIKKDGTVIFYTLDGRQSGYSYGAKKSTLAKRLLELGCVEAINLDGGGSTALAGRLPGTNTFELLNSPSDGGARSCANYFFLINNNKPTGIPYQMVVSDWGTPVLSGSSIQLKIEATYDSSFGPAQTPDAVVYTLTDDADTPSPTGKGSEVSPDGYVTVRGNGDVYIKAEGGGATGSTMIRTVATPDEIKIFNADTKKEVTQLSMFPEDRINLTAIAYWGTQEMVVDNGSFTWRVVSDDSSVGEITSDGSFTATGKSGATGIVAVNAGLRTYEIPVTIKDYNEVGEGLSRPEIKGSVENDAFIAIISDHGEELSKKNIDLFVDGEPTKFDYDKDTKTLTYEFPEGFTHGYHRIVVTATNSSELSAMSAHDIGSLNSKPNAFPDTLDNWAKHYISYMTENGVVKGSDDGLFYPNRSMNRTEFAIMLCNYLGINPDDYADVSLPFTDVNEIPWWALNNVKAIYSLGIMQGQLTDYGVAFVPKAEIKRMEYAISVERLLPKGLSKTAITATDKSDIPFWALESLKVAVGQGILNGYPDGTIKPAQPVTRAEAIKILHSIYGVGK